MISKTLDQEIRKLVADFQDLKSKNDKRSDLMLRRIRLKHPVFHLLTISAFKYVMDNGFLFKLKKDQTVYKQNQPARANVYFCLYGQLEFKTNGAKFGETMSLGWTIGEEILY